MKIIKFYDFFSSQKLPLGQKSYKNKISPVFYWVPTRKSVKHHISRYWLEIAVLQFVYVFSMIKYNVRLRSCLLAEKQHISR